MLGTMTPKWGWAFSFLRALVLVCVVVLGTAWVCTVAFYVRPAWLRTTASYGIYWNHAMPAIVLYVLPALSIAICVFACLEKQSHRRFRIMALGCAIVGLITAMVIPILEPARSW